MSGALRLAVFDCDGTLVDSQRSIVDSMEKAFAEQGLPVPSGEAVRRVVGLPLIGAMQVLAPDQTPEMHMELVEGYRRAFSALRTRGEVDEPLFPGAVESLDSLEADGWLLGVATGKAMRGLVSTLGTHDLGTRFVTKQTADLAPGKPNPDMLYRAMAETGAEPAETVMIGDTTFDIEMARNAGTHAIGVAWGYHDASELRAAGAHVIVETFGEVAGAANSLLEAN